MPPPTKTGTPRSYSREELEALLGRETRGSKVKLITIARRVGLDKVGTDEDDFETWDDVVTAIPVAQGTEEEVNQAGGSVPGGDDGPFDPYTEEDLNKIAKGNGTQSGKAKGLETLKKIVVDFGGEVPGARPRGDTLIKLILELQEAALREGAAEQEARRAQQAAEDDEAWEPYTEEDLQAMAEGNGTQAGRAKGIEKLKTILVEDFGGEVPGPRTRAESLIKLILAKQAELLAEGAEEAAGEEDDDEGGEDDEGVTLDLTEALEAIEAFKEEVLAEFASLKKDVAEAVELLADLKASLAKPAPAPAPVAPAAATKAAPAAQAAVRRLPPKRS